MITGFYNVSRYCFLILKFPVVPPGGQKWGKGVQEKFLLASLAGYTPTFKIVAPPLSVGVEQIHLCKKHTIQPHTVVSIYLQDWGTGPRPEGPRIEAREQGGVLERGQRASSPPARGRGSAVSSPSGVRGVAKRFLSHVSTQDGLI